MGARAVIDPVSGILLSEAIDDYRLSLHAAGKSTNTQSVYTLSLRYLDEFLAGRGMPRTLGAIRREHVEAWLADVRDKGRKPATVSVYYRSLQPFWKWAKAEGLVRESPMANMQPPLVPEQTGAGSEYRPTAGAATGLRR